ncbi:MAG: type II toxin-antitoxin system VapC family toxin [Geminicoccaceae bacterium]|nr:type II toxin-antitoxin system VapC family toxin [Geminicoccaceae bacterium]
MGFLIDTNVISEVRKGSRCDPGVAAWYAATDAADIYLSVLVLGEICKGVERVRPRDPARAAALDRWLMQIVTGFGPRVLPVDAPVAARRGQSSAARSVPVIDALLAATAYVHGLTLVTRNEADMRDSGAIVFNPFTAR